MSSIVDPQRSSRDPANAAFTLVELLVVLGIIVALGGITLFGAFEVRTHMGLAQCTSNLHQIGVAIKLYVADYDAIPLVWYGGGGVQIVGGRIVRRKRAPSPPDQSYDIRVSLHDYLWKPETFLCPILSKSGRDPVMWGMYRFNVCGAGLRMSEVHCGAARALLMFDPLSGLYWHRWHAHGCRINTLFLDGHVKAYKHVNCEDPAFMPNPMPIDWTSDHPTTW